MDTSSRSDSGEMFVPPPAKAKFSTLGFDAVTADAYWLMAVQLIGGKSIVTAEDAPAVAALIDVVTTLDPWVGHPYRFAANWLTESADAVLKANRLLRRAIAYHPDDWRNRHYLGFNHFYYFGENVKAARIIEKAVLLPGAPNYLANLVGKLRTDHDGLETTASFLRQLADSTDDEYRRAAYLLALDEVDTERRARVLDEARRRYASQHGRDIEAVSDLVAGPHPVLRRLPPAHPHIDGHEWILDEETGRIVSSYYGARYEPYDKAYRREKRERWRKQVQQVREGESR